MEEIELVIKIPEKVYNYVQQMGSVNMLDTQQVANAIFDAVPLQKGHGDLIDRGKLKTHFIGTEQGTDLEVYLEPTIINAPTIIEADKEKDE